MRALNLPRRDKVDDHRLRRVEYPGQAADGETPADRQGGAVQVVKPSGIPGEEPLVGGVEAVSRSGTRTCPPWAWPETTRSKPLPR